MLKHCSVLSIIIACLFSANTALAQDTPQDALDAGNVDQAISMLESQASQDDEDEAIGALCGQIQIAVSQKNFDRADELINSLQPRISGLKKKNGWRVVFEWLKAENAHQQGKSEDYKRGLNDALAAIQAGAKVNDVWEGVIYYNLSLEEADNSDARDYAEDAIKKFHGQKSFYNEGLAQIRLAELEFDRNKTKRGVKAYDAAVKAFKADGSPRALFKVVQTLITSASKLVGAEEIGNAKNKLALAKKELENIDNPAELAGIIDNLMNQLGD